jgi:hypothetical protein
LPDLALGHVAAADHETALALQGDEDRQLVHRACGNQGLDRYDIEASSGEKMVIASGAIAGQHNRPGLIPGFQG